mgnify:CR=1 FL=1
MPAPEPQRVAFRIDTPEGPLEGAVQTVDAPVPVVSVLAAARGLAETLLGVAQRHGAAQGTPVTCRRGCDACCHHLVPVTPAEAFALAHHVAQLPAAEQDAVRRRFDAALAQADAAGLREPLEATLSGEGFDHNADWFAARIPCPFLVDRACSIYEQRPIPCREHLVTSAPEDCDRPTPETVRPLPVFARVSRSLTQLCHEAWGDAPPRIPLPLALRWAEEHVDQRGVRANGTALLRKLIEEL